MLHYKIYSQHHDEWVVLVHGAGGSSSIWYKQIRTYRKHYNTLVIDLRGHGACTILNSPDEYTMNLVSKDILDVLDKVGITKAHFVGVSLGTILIRQLAESHPERFLSMVMAGAVIRLTPRLKFFIGIANTFKKFVPYMWLYKVFAWVLMPKEAHKNSRLLFVREAAKLKQKEFIRWLSLTGDVAKRLVKFNERETGIPCLYMMGEEDYVFLEPVKRFVKQYPSNELVVLADSGHVCNVDQAEQFNEISLSFLKEGRITS